MADGLAVWAKGHCLHNGWPLKRCLAWLINQSHHCTIRWPGTRAQKQNRPVNRPRSSISSDMTAPIQLAQPTETQSYRPITSHQRSQPFQIKCFSGPSQKGWRERKQNNSQFLFINIHHMPRRRNSELVNKGDSRGDQINPLRRGSPSLSLIVMKLQGF